MTEKGKQPDECYLRETFLAQRTVEVGRSFSASACQPGEGPRVLHNAIFAYAAAAMARVFLHMALNCLKSQEVYSGDWKFSLLRKCSTTRGSCFRKHIAGVGFGFGNFDWLVVFWRCSGIRGLH